MTGSLAVFHPGKLMARFPSRIRRAQSVSVQGIGDHGRDCGRVGQARFTAEVGNSK